MTSLVRTAMRDAMSDLAETKGGRERSYSHVKPTPMSDLAEAKGGRELSYSHVKPTPEPTSVTSLVR